MKRYFILLLFYLEFTTCRTQNVTDTGLVNKKHVEFYNPRFDANIKAWTLPLDSIKFDIDRIINSLYDSKMRKEKLYNLRYSIIVGLDSCGNIIDVSINNLPINRQDSLLNLRFINYFMSFKKLNIYYFGRNRHLEYLEIARLYFDLDENGLINHFMY